MIVQDQALQCLRCTVCHEVVELRQATVSRPDLVFSLKEEMASEHGPCEAFPDDLGRAMAERKFRRGLKAELGKLPRCGERRRAR